VQPAGLAAECAVTGADRWASAPVTAEAASVDQQHQLSAHVTLLADAVCVCDIGQRERLPDKEREPPGLNQVADLASV
jgi:hypothetical protein